LVCAVACGFAWRRRQTPEGAFTLGVCGSAILYVLAFAVVGVASDFRYGYWAVLAGIAGGVVAALAPSKPLEPAVQIASAPSRS
jgi:membrane associated rhomboid family serine protease